MKHHIVNSYSLYLLMKPASKIYTCSVNVNFMNSYRVSNFYGTWSMYDMDTQVKVNGWNGWQFASINAGNSMSGYSNSNSDPSEKVVEIQFYSGKPYSSLSSITGNCMLESGLIGNDPLNPISCTLDAVNNRLIFRNVFWFTDSQLNFYYYATTNSDSTNFDVRVYVWANEQAYANRAWTMFTSSTTQGWNYESINFASNTGWNDLSSNEMPFNSLDLPTGGSYGTTQTRILSSSNNVRSEGYSKILSVSNTQVKVRLYSSVSKSFNQVYRMIFRFYTPRLIFGSCSGASVWTSRWGWNNFNGYAYDPGSFSVTCGSSGRRFYVAFDMYNSWSQSRYPAQWPDFSNGDTYDFTINFSSVGGWAATGTPNNLWVSASMVWEQTYRYYQDSTCGCCNTGCCSCCCDNYRNGQWYYGECCSTCCTVYCSCRRILGWDYYTFTGTQGAGYAPTPSSLASSTSLALVSQTYGAETELSFWLGPTTKPITSTMTSYSTGTNA
jgi:hypothetical protein